MCLSMPILFVLRSPPCFTIDRTNYLCYQRDANNKYRTTLNPTIQAAKQGNVPILTYLINHGVDPTVGSHAALKQAVCWAQYQTLDLLFDDTVDLHYLLCICFVSAWNISRTN